MPSIALCLLPDDVLLSAGRCLRHALSVPKCTVRPTTYCLSHRMMFVPPYTVPPFNVWPIVHCPIVHCLSHHSLSVPVCPVRPTTHCLSVPPYGFCSIVWCLFHRMVSVPPYSVCLTARCLSHRAVSVPPKSMFHHVLSVPSRAVCPTAQCLPHHAVSVPPRSVFSTVQFLCRQARSLIVTAGCPSGGGSCPQTVFDW